MTQENGDAAVPSADTETAMDANDQRDDGDMPTGTVARQRHRPSRVGDMAALVLGGLLAALIGYGLATFGDGWPFDWVRGDIAAQTDRLARLQQDQGGLNDAQTALGEQVDALSATVDGLAPGTRLAELTSRIETVQSAIAEMDQRLTDLENRPVPDIGATEDAVDAYERELTAMREMFQAELERIEAAQGDAFDAQARAAEASRNAQIRAAVSRLSAAVDAGRSLAGPVDELKQAGVTVPEELQAHVNGTIGIAGLAERFPDMAREVLALDLKSRAERGEINRVEAFLRSQVNARSLAPKPGDDADAILSRAEAALGEGDVATALSELDALPDTGSALLQDWLSQAADLMAARHAVAQIASKLDQ